MITGLNHVSIVVPDIEAAAPGFPVFRIVA